jgi:hypothetical protein
VCEHRLRQALGLPTEDPTENLTYYSHEMEECAAGYAAYVMELVETAKRQGAAPLVLIEQRLDISGYVQGCYGTADCIVVGGGRLDIIDFKYGQGVAVDAQGNTQMMMYALGALSMLDGIYDITDVSMTIYQPRRDSVSTYTLTKDALYEWAEETLKPAAALAYTGEGEQRAGGWCVFCKAKAECRKRAEENMSLAAYDFKPPALLEDDEVESILGKIDGLVAWAGDVKDYALQAALGGKHWQDWKLVAGRSTRRFTDEDAVAVTLRREVAATEDELYKRELRGITELERWLGKAKFAELLGGYITKPAGKPTLAPKGDKRPALNTAAEDFAVNNE